MAEEFAEKHDPHFELTLVPMEDLLAATDRAEGSEDLSARGPAAVRQALTQRGVRETGGAQRGIPLTRYVRYFIPGSGPLPWCAFFVSWCFDTTGDGNHKVAWGNAGYVGSIRDWAGRESRLVTVPRHGDIFGIGTQHTGLVAGANPDKGVIWTIEGNYGDAVAQRTITYRSAGLWFARF